MAEEKTMARKTKIMKEDREAETTRVIKRRKRETTLDDLPNVLLTNIISSLPLVEAARTSVLAKGWRSLWRHTTHLDFDETSMFKSSTALYIAVIGIVLNSHIGDLTSVRFKCFNRSIGGVELWVDFVLNKYKKITSLSLECERLKPNPNDDSQSSGRSRLPKIVRPNFRPMVFSTLSSLELINYKMKDTSMLKAFDGCGAKLKTLKMKNMYMSDDVINGVLSKCLCLESLSVVKSKGFGTLVINNNPCLKFLELGWLDVEEVDVDVEGLETLVVDSLMCPPTNFKIYALDLRILKVSCSSSVPDRTRLLKTHYIFEHCSDLYCGSGRVRPSEDFADELFVVQCAQTREEHFNFHKNLQCSSDLQGTVGGGPARPLRRSCQMGRNV
ncbi:hypothetical protein PIB30_000109 [Stylosanthes scabra]|uniref:F-box domain-containing protein n=1 Tax=Stylosanthes scabra TaxID=79078 RepID=A0ABU6R184_9FABA|nr:hypothetical protein [Stylosanthes scabra]